MRQRASFLLVSTFLSSFVSGVGETAEGDRLERRDPMARPIEVELAAAWSRDHLTSSTAPRLAFTFVYGGRPSRELLVSWERRETKRELDANRTELTCSYRDPKTGLVCTCRAITFLDCPAIDWLLLFENTGTDETPILERIAPLDMNLAPPMTGAITLHHALGDSNSKDSFRPADDVLSPEVRILLAPGGGRSSDPHLPFFNLDWQMGGMAIAVGWSGQWEAEFAGTADRGVRVRAGMQLTHLKLRPGESIRTPRILAILWDGPDPLRGNHLMRRAILEHYAPRRNGKLVLAPICASVNETDPDGTYEGPHIRPLKTLAERGIEVFWSDMDPQQWYPGGFPGGTGTWVVDPAKYPHGLKPVGDAARAAGIGYLLWFEPERVHFGTQIERDHPGWVMKPKGEWSQLFALQIPESRAWMTNLLDRFVTDLGLSWIRWDFNIEPLGFWRRSDEPDRQGMTEIKYIEGLYAVWDQLMERHPGLVIDLCASGGRRLDLESLTRGIPLWHSDLQCSGPDPAADQLQNAGLWRWLPMHGCGNFGLEPSYVFRSAMTTGNILCVVDDKGRINTADRDTEETVKRTVATYVALRPYLVGDFYPLLPHDSSENVWFAYQFHRPDLGAGLVMAFRRSASADVSARLKLRGIDPDGRYAIRDRDARTTAELPGRELMEHGLLVSIPDRLGSAIIEYLRT